MKLQLSKLIALAFLLVSAQISIAENIGPGVYHGYFATDRWGQKIFHAGPYHLFVSDEAAKQLDAHAGQPLKLTVSSVYQPQNPGGAIIDKINNITIEDNNSGLTFDAKAEITEVKKGDGVKLALTVRNESTHEIRLNPNNLAISLVTNSPYSNAAIGYADPEDRAYWYYSTAIQSRTAKTWSVVACHEIRLPWLPQDFAAKGKAVTVGVRTPTHIEPGYYYPLLIQPNGELHIETTVGRELLSGQYEVFFYQPTGNLSYAPGPMSKRISFNIVEPVTEQK